MENEKGYAEAWKKACQLFEASENDGDVNDFICNFHDLMVVYGNPNKQSPGGVIDASKLPKEEF